MSFEWINDMPPYKLDKRIDCRNKIKYVYFNHYKYSEIWFEKSKYSDAEIQLVDELFNNLDAGNLAMIKGILHSKTKSRKYIRIKEVEK